MCTISGNWSSWRVMMLFTTTFIWLKFFFTLRLFYISTGTFTLNFSIQVVELINLFPYVIPFWNRGSKTSQVCRAFTVSYLWNTVSVVCVARGLQPVAEMVLSYLDASSLCSAEFVCREWRRVTTDGNIWKRIIERRVSRDPIWAGLAQKRSWCVHTTSQRALLHHCQCRGLECRHLRGPRHCAMKPLAALRAMQCTRDGCPDLPA